MIQQYTWFKKSTNSKKLEGIAITYKDDQISQKTYI